MLLGSSSKPQFEPEPFQTRPKSSLVRSSAQSQNRTWRRRAISFTACWSLVWSCCCIDNTASSGPGQGGVGIHHTSSCSQRCRRGPTPDYAACGVVLHLYELEGDDVVCCEGDRSAVAVMAVAGVGDAEHLAAATAATVLLRCRWRCRCAWLCCHRTLKPR